jgi:capsular polysaccharide biosynthesis protein
MESLNGADNQLAAAKINLINKGLVQTVAPDIILMDYVKILLNRKLIISSIVTFVTAAAVIINLLIPPTYEAQTILVIGQYKNKPIESLNTIISVFYSDEYLKRIADALSLPVEADYSSAKKMFIIEKDKKTDLLLIKARGKTPEIAVNNVKIISEIILSRHNELFSVANKMFGAELNTIKKGREKILIDIKTLGNMTNQIDADIRKYETEIQKKNNAQSDAQGRIAESYINLVASLKDEKNNILFQISTLNQNLSANDQKLQQKEFEKEYETKLTKVEIAPVAPKMKIAPNRRRNVIAAFCFALIFGVFVAFSVEYYQKFKYKLKSV